ncbi:MAG: hypothetical protein U1F98_12355 [Verrucomicrobiota bacterium]
MRLIRLLPLALAARLWAGAPEVSAPDGDSVVRARAGSSEIVLRTSARMAGAIDSLQWNGKEFLDAADHGRELQSAANFDVGGLLRNEAFNPTEAGSRDDGAGPRSSSRLLYLKASGAELVTTNQMAFWLQPGEFSGTNPAANTTALSNHRLAKLVHIGVPGFPNAIDYTVVFFLPEGEPHVEGTFEALTGYMPAEFDTFWTFDAAAGTLAPLDAGPGEQPRPVVVSTRDGRYAMGIYSPPDPRIPDRTYGRFKFDSEKVSKWNCVFRIHNPNGIAPGAYACRMQVIVGSLETVRATLAGLCPQKPTRKPGNPDAN